MQHQSIHRAQSAILLVEDHLILPIIFLIRLVLLIIPTITPIIILCGIIPVRVVGDPETIMVSLAAGKVS
jgi:hypothetical protein